MLIPSSPVDETHRLAALQQYGVIDIAQAASFDDLTALAAQVCETPIALISLIDAEHQQVKSQHGLDLAVIPRDVSLCAHTISPAEPSLMIVPDALADERFADNPLVLGAPHLRFYASMPLVAPDGHAIGALCVIDHTPRTLTDAQLQALRILRDQVMAQLELRRHVAALAQASAQQLAIAAKHADDLARLSATLDAVADAILVVDNSGAIVSFNQPFVALWSLPDTILATKDDRAALGFVLDQLADPGAFLAKVESLYAQPEASSLDVLDFKDGRIIERYSHPYSVSQQTIGRVWGFRDITERRRAEVERERLREEIIQTQANTLIELSIPLIPITDQVMVMPLIGTVDTRRAQAVLDTLLQGVAAKQARVVILDITGVPVVDTQVANGLMRAAQAVQLLGARMVLTGIRPEVAQTLVGLNVNLHSIVTRSTLQSGIAFAISLAA